MQQDAGIRQGIAHALLAGGNMGFFQIRCMVLG